MVITKFLLMLSPLIRRPVEENQSKVEDIIILYYYSLIFCGGFTARFILIVV